MSLDYSFVYEKDGKYSDIWLAGTNQKQFRQKIKRNIDMFKIQTICEGINRDILHMNVSNVSKSKKPPKKRRRIIQETETQEYDNSPFSLKLASNLMLGTARIWSQQVDKLLEESKSILNKQTIYNKIIQAEQDEEERRKVRVNYAEMLEGVGHSAKRGKKKGHPPTKFLVKDFEKFEEVVTTNEEQTEIFNDLNLNTAHVDQITLRETALAPPLDDLALNEFEPLQEHEINQLMEGLNFTQNASQFIDPVRDAPALECQSIHIHETSFHNVVTENEPPGIPKIDEIPEVPIPPVPEPVEVQIEDQPKVVPEPPVTVEDPNDVLKLPKLEKDTITKRKPKAKRGQKRKVDDVIKISRQQMQQNIKNYSDIVLPSTSLEPLKKFKLESPLTLLQNSGHANRSFTSKAFTEDFATKIKFLSLTEKTRKRKINAVAKTTKQNEEPVRKKLRTIRQLPKEVQAESAVTKICEDPAQQMSQATRQPPNETEIQPDFNTNIDHIVSGTPAIDVPPISLPHNDLPVTELSVPPEIPPPEEPFMPEFDTMLKELLPDQESNEVLLDPRSQEAKSITKWKSVRKSWGHSGLLKKLFYVFREHSVDHTTIEQLIEKERTKMVGTMTFSSLIHLKAKQFVVLDKNAQLMVIRIEIGLKMKKVLSKMTTN